MKKNDLTGKRIGYWDVGDAFHKGKKIYYHCVCSLCGKKRDVQSSPLNTGRSLSCGCHVKNARVDDLTGQYFGLLHVKERVIINGVTHWLCSCECGNSIVISQHRLHDCNIKSCGCKGTFKESIKKSHEKYYVDGTYTPGLVRKQPNKNNTSGHTGVSFKKERNKWRAYIKFQRKNIHLGHFDSIEDAIAVRKAAEMEFFGKYLDTADDMSEKG